MGLPYTAAHGTIRFSLSRFNTAAEIDKVIEALPPIIGPAPGNLSLLAGARQIKDSGFNRLRFFPEPVFQIQY